MAKTTKQIISEAEETLYTAKLGLNLMYGDDPKARLAGFRNVVVFGRAVTNVLQNIRSTAGASFDEWYQPKVDEMACDKIMKHLYKLRSIILKQGTLQTRVSASMSGNPTALIQRNPAPPNAKGFFILDSLGGCGWEVEVEPGVTEKYYINIENDSPEFKMSASVTLAGAPKELSEHSIQDLSNHYINYLENLVNEAKIEFK